MYMIVKIINIIIMIIMITYTAGTPREASNSKRAKFNDQHESEHVDSLHCIFCWLLGEHGDDDDGDDDDDDGDDDDSDYENNDGDEESGDD